MRAERPDPGAGRRGAAEPSGAVLLREAARLGAVLPEEALPAGVPPVGEQPAKVEARAQAWGAAPTSAAVPIVVRRRRAAPGAGPDGTEARTAPEAAGSPVHPAHPVRPVHPAAHPDHPAHRVHSARAAPAAPAAQAGPAAPAARQRLPVSAAQHSWARRGSPAGCTNPGLRKPVRSSPRPRNLRRNRARRSLRHPPRAPSTAQHCSQTDARDGMRTRVGPPLPRRVSPSGAAPRAGPPQAASASRRRTGARAARTTA